MKKNCWKSDEKKSRKSLRCELLNIWYARRILYLLAALLVCITGVYLLGYSQLSDLCETYNDVCELYAEDPLQMQEDLQEESICREEGAVMTIENPVRYYRDRIEALAESQRPRNSMTLACETSLIVFPALFALLGCFAGSTDYRDRTIKMKVTRFGKMGYAAGKARALLLIIAVVTILYYLLFPAVAGILWQWMKSRGSLSLPNGIALGKTVLTEENAAGGSALARVLAKAAWIIRPALSIFTGAGFCMLGLFLSNLMKGAALGTVLALVYALQPFSLGYADLAAYFQRLSEKLCSYSGVISFTLQQGHVLPAFDLIIPAAACIALWIGYRICILKRSAYC